MLVNVRCERFSCQKWQLSINTVLERSKSWELSDEIHNILKIIGCVYVYFGKQPLHRLANAILCWSYFCSYQCEWPFVERNSATIHWSILITTKSQMWLSFVFKHFWKLYSICRQTIKLLWQSYFRKNIQKCVRLMVHRVWSLRLIIFREQRNS